MNYKDKKTAVMKVLKEYDLDSSAVWDCHGTPVILHKALESIQVQAQITFGKPDIIETDADKKIAVICVYGTKGERSEWSIGEAMPSNNKNAYPFAMAEKRGKDRVILKLIDLHGLAYSEEEADDFKAAKKDYSPAPHKDDLKDFIGVPNVKCKSAYQCNKDGDYTRLCDLANEMITDRKQVPQWVKDNMADIAVMPPSFRHHLKEAIEELMEILREQNSIGE